MYYELYANKIKYFDEMSNWLKGKNYQLTQDIANFNYPEDN